MSQFDPLGFSAFGLPRTPPPTPQWVIVDRPLHRILRFTGRSIDDVVNSPIAKNEVIGYFKLQKYVNRRMEIVELEKQWNSVG